MYNTNNNNNNSNDQRQQEEHVSEYCMEEPCPSFGVFREQGSWREAEDARPLLPKGMKKPRRISFVFWN
jgi:hypothetical protein